MKLILARHGETVLNQQHKFYGSLDTNLDQKGQQQAVELAKKVAIEQPTIIVRTPLTRTMQTLAPFIQHNPLIPVLEIPELVEKDFGNWEGLDADEIQARYPQEWQTWLDHPLTYTPPTSESFQAFEDRVLRSLLQLLNKFDENDSVFIVAHLGTLRIFYQALVKNDYFYDIQFKAGDYSLIELDPQLKLTSVKMNL